MKIDSVQVVYIPSGHPFMDSEPNKNVGLQNTAEQPLEVVFREFMDVPSGIEALKSL